MKRLLTALVLVLGLTCQARSQTMNFDAIDGIIQTGIQQKKFPGAVVVIGHNGQIVFHKAYGMASLGPSREAMTEDTIFDLASLTKPLVTATAIMQLYQRKRFGLDDPVARYLPAFSSHGKERITIRELLTHYSGLRPDLPLTTPWTGKDEGFRLAFATVPVSEPGKRFLYSDINYIVLQALAEKLSGLSLEVYQQKFIAQPLGLPEMRFLPSASWRDRIAPTQYDAHGVMLQGTVNDETARRMGGVAGNAGLFATANEVAVFAQSLLDRLAGRPSNFPLDQSVLRQMISPNQPAGASAVRGLGWDIDSPFSSPRGDLFPIGSFGHTGYTGTSLWIDPASNAYVILLSNSVYPRGHPSLSAIRSAIATCAAAAVESGQRSAGVMTGIDVLEADRFAPLALLAQKHNGHLRLGLLTNQTGVDHEGRRTADILVHDAAVAVPGLTLKTLFSPEHGINGALDTDTIHNSTDATTGLPVISLYGATDAARRPPLDAMRGLDAVVIDLQDAGVRFYTYETLVLYFLEAAARTGTEIVVLDRPDPIGGAIQGPLSDPGRESYVNAMPIPIRHGMTLGELARYFNGERHLAAPLTVVAMRGWRRRDWFDETGLSWINPSPNLTSLTAATLYPAIGLIETTNLSVGRGTDHPFEYVGAAWIDEAGSSHLAEALNARALPGVRFLPASFTPKAPYPYAGQLCHGIEIAVTRRDAMDAPEAGLEIASAIYRLYPTQLELAKIDTLLVNRAILDALLAGKDPKQIAGGWQKDLRKFELGRKRYLLY
jgi:uncharacterized protein YbbC (DUF1343 family)